jgi:DNA-binding GntR family transcriptional regulator
MRPFGACMKRSLWSSCMGGSQRRRGRPKHASQIALRGARKLDRDSSVPLHFQLGEILKERLEAGHWPPGTLFPSEREIEEHFGVTRTVIRPALDLLEADGAVSRVRGSGTFVAPPKRTVPVAGLVRAISGVQSEDIGLTVLRIRENCRDSGVAEALEIPNSPRLLGHVTAVLHRDDPICVIDSFVSVGHVPWLLPITRALHAGEGPPAPEKLELTRAPSSIEGSSFGRWAAAQLGVSAGDPALVGRVLQYGVPRGRKRERPIELARIVFRSDIAQLKFEIS